MSEVFQIVNKLPLNESIADKLAPVVQLPNINRNSVINAVNPGLVIKSFGLQALQTEIYLGRIPIATPDKGIGRISKLGTSLFSDLKFSDVNGITHIPVDMALFNVNQAKNIIRTPIQGRDGQIKEYNGEDDFEISIKGVICGDNGVYPWDQVTNLVYFCRYNQSLGITSRYLNDLFDIQEIVIKDYAFEQSEGSQSYQKFEINCWSEKPVEILIQEGK